ncbi:MAG: ABC transporter substrate-binding protein [Acidaminococcaceae bacterium]
MSGRQYHSLLFIVLLFISILMFGGCTNNNQNKPVSNAGKGYMVMDATGTKVNFLEKPKRIISLSSSVDEILLDMLPPERIAALTNLADDPGICSTTEKAKAVKQRVQSKNVEAILSLNPDLVLMPDWLGPEKVQGLRDVGIKVYVYKTPVTLTDIQKSIIEIATVVDAREQGDKLVLAMQKKLDNVQQKLKDLPSDKKQVVVPLSLMGAFGGKGTTFDDICNYANVTNGISAAGIDKNAVIAKEKIVEINPDAFILPTWDFGKSGDAENFINETMSDPAFETVKAIRNKRLIQIHDAYLYSISHYAANAVDEIARAVYPEYF